MPAIHSDDQQVFLHATHLELAGKFPSLQWWYCTMFCCCKNKNIRQDEYKPWVPWSSCGKITNGWVYLKFQKLILQIRINKSILLLNYTAGYFDESEFGDFDSDIFFIIYKNLAISNFQPNKHISRWVLRLHFSQLVSLDQMPKLSTHKITCYIVSKVHKSFILTKKLRWKCVTVVYQLVQKHLIAYSLHFLIQFTPTQRIIF